MHRCSADRHGRAILSRIVSDTLPAQRWRMFLEQFAAEHGDGWHSELARRLAVHPSTIQRYAAGRRKGVSFDAIQSAIDSMGIARDFFFEPGAGSKPHYRQYLASADRTEPSESESPHWRRFVSLRIPETLGLRAEEVEWLRTAPFRGGARSVDDYITAAEALLRRDLPEPDEMQSARARNREQGVRPVDLTRKT